MGSHDNPGVLSRAPFPSQYVRADEHVVLCGEPLAVTRVGAGCRGTAFDASAEAEELSADGRKRVEGRRCLPLEVGRPLVNEKARRIRLSTLFSSYR